MDEGRTVRGADDGGNGKWADGQGRPIDMGRTTAENKLDDIWARYDMSMTCKSGGNVMVSGLITPPVEGS